MRLEGKKVIRPMLTVLFVLVILSVGTAAGWDYLFHRPYRMQADCRGKEIDIKTMQYWEKRGENGFLDMINIAGWRIGIQKNISSVSTGRKQRTRVIYVYGSMELAIPATVLSGKYGLAIEGDYCVLSEELARHLFGSVDVAGECIKIEQRKLTVAGVIEKEGDFLMVPMEEGTIEELAVEFAGQFGAEEKMKELLGE